jgi:hypothetical protein
MSALPKCWCKRPSVTKVSTAKGEWGWVCPRCLVTFNRLKAALEQEDAERLVEQLERSICQRTGETK